MAQPVLFTDSLGARGAPLRYRQIGNPYAFLAAIGIEPILDEVYKGRNIVDVARTLNIGIGVLLRWLEEEQHMAAVEKAATFSAEGYLSEAGHMLREAQTEFALKKAKEVASHNRFMASKLDRPKYGQESHRGGDSTGVTFVMHIGDKKVEYTAGAETKRDPLPSEVQVIEGQFMMVPTVPPTPKGVVEPDEVGPFEDVPFIPDAACLPEYLKDESADHADE